MRFRLSVCLVAALISLPLLVGCGKTLPAIPSAPVITTTADTDVRAGAIKAEGILLAAGTLANHASLIETDLAASGVIPQTVHRQIQAEFGRLAASAQSAVTSIDNGSAQSWPALKAQLDPILSDVQRIIDLSHDLSSSTSSNKWAQALTDLQSILGQAAALIPAH